MKNITREEFKNIVNSIQLNASDDVIDEIMNLWSGLKNRITIMNSINTDNIEPLTHLNESPKVDFLREDVVDEKLVYISKKDLLENAKEFNDDFIITKKVVK